MVKFPVVVMLTPDAAAATWVIVTPFSTTTEAALLSFGASGIAGAIEQGIIAAEARGRELGDLLGKVGVGCLDDEVGAALLRPHRNHQQGCQQEEATSGRRQGGPRYSSFHALPHFRINSERVSATSLWRTLRRSSKGAGYLFNHKALAKVFRAKMLSGIEATGLTLPGSHPEKWVVDCKSVGSGEKALIYLGRYLYRGVIAEKDIVACDNGQVSFRYRDAKTGRMELRIVSGAQFLWLVLQHVLPKGFRRARNFGFLHPNSKRLIALLQVVLKVIPGTDLAWMKPRPPFLCACCGAPMRVVRRRAPPTEHRPPASGFAGMAEM